MDNNVPIPINRLDFLLIDWMVTNNNLLKINTESVRTQ